MQRYSLILVLAMMLPCWTVAQQKHFTHVSDKMVKTLQVRVAGEIISTPCIPLQGDRQIEINFDALGGNMNRYAYSIIHCNADWTQSPLSPIEYMEGFQGLTIDDFANSMGTTVQYTNYRLLLPNDDVQFKVSGNYAVRVYHEDTPDQTAFIACFSVVEPLVNVAGTISGNTDIDTHQTHQQLAFDIYNKNFPITYPQSDLKIWIYQNNRRDNAVTQLQPTAILENQIHYSNQHKLIFNAGNEYRRFEFLSNKYNGMHIENISFHNPYYHVELMLDENRNKLTYQYDQDQNGRYFIRCSNCSDPDTESDYYIVHFTLPIDPILDGKIYLNGDLTDGSFSPQNEMIYSEERQQYEKSLLLKQGSYNYQYLVLPNNQTTGITAPIEGDFHQTENEYSIYIFYHPMGARYDRLIGVTTLRNAMNLF